ncbi:hypothetical protein SAMN05421738_11444 [Algoriella xinjiangensis]|uniref:Lipoprotein n=1 Tax=Algoriella xinjiangensis TaxID=684065 RepID=A0A1I4ZSV2_9FLAO|nr:hypothetical protein [Algoriella xinjiangensis]SFN53133.1 hypothetical protein SAMN05421738_11444 [Algoriella xinjiangensis]VDH16328.1 Uncharacterised protein [Algoriella xinjiangensis]
MKKNICFVIIFFSVMQSCEKKKEDSKVLALNNATYENALDVPVDKVGVIINIDSLGFFNHNSQNLEENINSEVIQNQIKLLNTKFDVAQLIKDKSVKILDENNYKYDMIHQFNQNEIPKDLVTKENVKNVNFDQLQKNFNQDDLVVLNVKSGLDYNPDNKQKYVAKTYVYLNILDLKNKKLKYSETIGGTKYIDEVASKISTSNLEKKLKESLTETLEIIDNKY